MSYGGPWRTDRGEKWPAWRLVEVRLGAIYGSDTDPDSVFVITAYPLGPKAMRALRRRRRRKS
jgi:hypothetical protein